MHHSNAHDDGRPGEHDGRHGSTPAAPVMASVIVPLYNNVELTRACVDSVHAVGLPEWAELVLVDNASTDGTGAYLDTLARDAGSVQVVRNATNENFSGACNIGASVARGSVLVFLNNDTEVTRGWLEALIAPLSVERVGIVGGRLLYPDGTVQHAGVAFGDDRMGFHVNAGARADDPAVLQPRSMQAVTAACMAIRRELFEELGGFDTAYRNGLEDVELCLRARQAGHDVWYQPRCVVTHHESKAAGRFAHAAHNIALFRSRWALGIAPDAARFRPADAARLHPAAGDAAQGAAHHQAAGDATLLPRPARAWYAGELHADLDTVIVAAAGDAEAQRWSDALAGASPRTVELLRVDIGDVDDVSRAAAANEALARARGGRIAVLLDLSGGDGAPACGVLASSHGDVTLVGAAEAPCGVMLTREVLDAVGAFDLRCGDRQLMLLDLAARAARAGFATSSGAVLPVRAAAERRPPSHDGRAYFAARHLRERRPMLEPARDWRDCIGETYVPPTPAAPIGEACMEFETRTCSLLLPFEPADPASFQRAARHLFASLGPGDDITIVVRAGAQLDAAAGLLEEAASGVADADLPDLVLLESGPEADAALCRSVDAVICDGRAAQGLYGLAVRSGVATLRSGDMQALEALTNRSEAA